MESGARKAFELPGPSLLFARLFAAAIFLSLCSCTNPRNEAEKILEKTGAPKLRRDAALLSKALFAGHGTDFVVVRQRDWPESFRRFSPIRVGAYPDGISLAIMAEDDRESGLYIVPATMEHQPSVTHGGKFQRLADGIYWYSFGE